MKLLTTPGWDGYTLLATGNRQRLEQVGDVCVLRPESQALWLWPSSGGDHKRADVEYQGETGDQPWRLFSPVPEDGWWLPWQDFKFKVKLTPFRHLGIFPEQAAEWSWLQEQISSASTCEVLNLFGYTGAASVVAAKAGAQVCHVDASKPAVTWAAENARANGVEARWIVDDVRKFVAREAKRARAYDIVLLDPPVFGRGPKGEVWRLEEGLPDLLRALKSILKPGGRIWLNVYATDTYPLTIQRLAETALCQPLELGVLALEEHATKKPLQTGFFLRSC